MNRSQIVNSTCSYGPRSQGDNMFGSVRLFVLFTERKHQMSVDLVFPRSLLLYSSKPSSYSTPNILSLLHTLTLTFDGQMDGRMLLNILMQSIIKWKHEMVMFANAIAKMCMGFYKSSYCHKQIPSDSHDYLLELVWLCGCIGRREGSAEVTAHTQSFIPIYKCHL